ncbi:MAG: undecaprenyl-diphosphate phosphatase, partial [Oscillospiraceae bacterium]|nr:undecaprenyl-diphosphate phosphatase [Oscillospiraceae bacterium]
MSFWNAILQGIIQGLTEFLPVSSSGHLSLYQHFTGQSGEAAGLFSILLHLGTLAAVCIAFWDTIWGMIVEFFRMIGDILKGKFTFHTTDPNRRMIFMIV